MREVRIVNDFLEQIVVIADWVELCAAEVEERISISVSNVVTLGLLNVDECAGLNWVLENTEIVSLVLLVSTC